jgi:hypothetical protein
MTSRKQQFATVTAFFQRDRQISLRRRWVGSAVGVVRR